MGQNQSSPNSADYTTNIRLSKDSKNRFSALDYENLNLTNKRPDSLKKSSSFIDYVPSREKQIFRDDMSCSYNDYSEARISSTTLKSKRSSTVKSYIISQDRRRSEDFDMGQMEENTDVLKKNSNFSENIPSLDSTLSPNAVLLRARRKNLNRHPKSSSFLLSSSQTSSAVYQNSFKPDNKAIGPHFSEKVNQQLQGKEVDDETEGVLKTETNEREIEPLLDIAHKDAIHFTESSLCRMESVGFPVVDKFKESKHADDEVRILETCGSRFSSPKQTLTNQYSPNLLQEYSHKKSSMKKEDNRYGAPIMIASFEDEQIGSHHIRDSDIMSLSSSEPDHHMDISLVDDYKNLSPEKTNKSFKSISRKDGDYQEVEFSFKPTSLTKGSRRYTAEGDNGSRYRLKDEPKKIELNGESIDNENPLVKNLHFNSIESFCLQQPSVEKDIYKISPFKSSSSNVLRDLNARYTQEHNKEFEELPIRQSSTSTILHGSRELPFTETAQIFSKESQSQPITDLENKTPSEYVSGDPNIPISVSLSTKNQSPAKPLGESIIYGKEVLVEEALRLEGGGKENRPSQVHQNMYKLQQIIKSDTKSKKQTDAIKAPGVFTAGRVLQNMNKGIKVSLQNTEAIPNGLMRVQNFYQYQSSVSDKGNSFSKEASGSSSSFLRVLKDNENVNKAIPSRLNSVYTLDLVPAKRSNLRNEKLRPSVGNYRNESQTSFHIDDSISRIEKRRKSEFNSSKIQRGGPVKCHNKAIIQETCCVSTATSGNEVSINTVKPTKQVESELGSRKTYKGARSVTSSSRASVERNASLGKGQPKKNVKDLGYNRENQCPEEPLYTLILPVTSPKDSDILAKTWKANDDNKKKGTSSKLNKTSSYGLLAKEDFSQGERTIKTPTDQKRNWIDKDQSMTRSKSTTNQRKKEFKLGFNETLNFPEKSFLRITSEIQSEKANEGGQNSKILKNLLKGQIERPQRKHTPTDKSERDIKMRSMSKTLNLQDKSEAKSPYLKKRVEAR